MQHALSEAVVTANLANRFQLGGVTLKWSTSIGIFENPWINFGHVFAAKIDPELMCAKVPPKVRGVRSTKRTRSASKFLFLFVYCFMFLLALALHVRRRAMPHGRAALPAAFPGERRAT